MYSVVSDYNKYGQNKGGLFYIHGTFLSGTEKDLVQDCGESRSHLETMYLRKLESERTRLEGV